MPEGLTWSGTERGGEAMTTTEALAVGQPMPEVALRDLEGRVRRLADYRGRPLLVFMWASW
jgi:hypothetical protein